MSNKPKGFKQRLLTRNIENITNNMYILGVMSIKSAVGIQCQINMAGCLRKPCHSYVVAMIASKPKVK